MTQALALRNPHDLASWGDRKLDNAIRRGHATAGAHERGYEEAATATGLLLIERKRRLGHGRWLPWLAGHFDGSEATAKRYMQAAERWLANRSSVSDLDPPAEPPGEVVDGDAEEVTPPAPAPSRAKRNGETELVHWLPDMLPGANPEGAFREEVLKWSSHERSIDGMLDDTGILLVPKSDDDRDALLGALAAIHQTAARLERQLR